MPTRTACDTCKRRKVKCDLVDPCANCRISRLTCEYTIVARKRGRKPTRDQVVGEQTNVSDSHQTTTPACRPNKAAKRPRRQQQVETDDDKCTLGPETEQETAMTGEEPTPSTSNLEHHDCHGLSAGTQSSHSEADDRLSYAGDSALSFGAPDTPLGTSLLALQRPFEFTSSPPSVFTSQLFLSGISNETTDLAEVSPIEPYPAAVARRVRENLVSLVNETLTTETIVDVIHQCIDQFIQYIFPSTPLIHEPTIRAGAALFQLLGQSDFYEPSDQACWRPRIANLRSFVNVAALCAGTLSVLPDSIIDVQRRDLTSLFLDAARAMLALYEEYDLEHPDYTSLTSRLWLSSALQNTTGRTGLSRHYLWQASLLSQSLQLYDEEVVRQKPPVESQLLRMCFWQLYSADNAALAFGARPFVLHKNSFHGELTLLHRGEHHVRLLAADQPLYALSLEDRLLSGFTLKHRLWAAAGDFLCAARAYARREGRGHVFDEQETTRGLADLTRCYLAFASLMDNFPPWLQYFDGMEGTVVLDSASLSFQKTCFYVQRINLMSTFYALHLVILKKCIEHDVLASMGLENQPLPLAIKEVDMVNDLLKVLHAAPFHCFKVQGEAAIERIRFVGASLLQLKQTTQIDMIKTRVNVLFKALLDLLTKLDSKASDDLNVNGA